MRFLKGLVLAGGLILASAQGSHAQVAVSIGNPLFGNGIRVGTGPYAYGYPAYGYSYPTYGYRVARPSTYFYSSGYRGWAAPGYSYSPYRSHGYGYGPRGVLRGNRGGWGRGRRW